MKSAKNNGCWFSGQEVTNNHLAHKRNAYAVNSLYLFKLFPQGVTTSWKGLVFVQISQINKNFSDRGGKSPSIPLSLDSFLEKGFEFEPSYNPFESEEPDYRHYLLLRALNHVLNQELTEAQRICVQMFYFDGKNVKQIAEELGVGSPTVSKHISKGLSNIRRILRYLFDPMP